MEQMRLICTDGSRRYVFPLQSGRFTIGREDTCDFHVANPTISRRHAEIEVDGEGRCFVTDLGSHNGTYVNGQRLSARTELPPGTTLILGQVEFHLAGKDLAESALAQQSVTQLAGENPELSLVMPLQEALQPLPIRVIKSPELFSILSEMARMLIFPEPEEEMLEKALHLVARAIPSERLAILNVSSDSTEVNIAASLLPGQVDPGTFILSQTIINDIITKKSSIVIGNIADDSRFARRDSIMATGLKSAMAVPLFDEDKVLGILYVDSSNPLHSYSEDYLRLLATFGHIIASRLLNYELLRTRQEKQIIESELIHASRIQRDLLIENMPMLTGYEIEAFQEQCRAVGGDLYDVAVLPDGRLFTLIADVSGKGMGAALLMANVLAAFRTQYDRTEFELIGAVKEVSRQLCRYCSTGDFVTIFVGLLDPRAASFRFVNAGHNPGLLIRRDGSVMEMEASGLMAGVFEEAKWREEIIQLLPQDVLCLYTDGITEATDPEAHQFGEERLHSELILARQHNAQQIAHRLVHAIEAFVGHAPASDDLTLLVIKYI